MEALSHSQREASHAKGPVGGRRDKIAGAILAGACRPGGLRARTKRSNTVARPLGRSLIHVGSLPSSLTPEAPAGSLCI